MASVKKFNNNLIIQSTGISSNITLDAETVIVPGDFTVLGTTTSVDSDNLTVKDNIIVLNDGETGNGVTLGSAGITVDRGIGNDVTLRWLESSQVWQLTSDGTNYANILVAGGIGSGLEAVVDDPAPVLGGNLNTDGYTISANANVIFGSNVQLNVPATLPSSAVDDATVVYADAPGGGTAGVYVLNNSAANEELVTKTRAFGFSLIL
jgi:hypothetical protein